MSIEVIQGDLFDPAHNFDALAQGVNCRGIMGAGIAVKFREMFPLMYKEYIELCDKYHHVLPGYTDHSIVDWAETIDDSLPEVFNLFTQYYPGQNATYEYLEKSTFHLLRLTEDTVAPEEYRVGMPWIGCGIGGLQRHNVYHILNRYLDPSRVQFFIVQPEEVDTSSITV